MENKTTPPKSPMETVEKETKEVKAPNMLSLNKDLQDFKEDVGGKFDNIKTLLEGIVNKDKTENTVREEYKAPSKKEFKKPEEVELTDQQNEIFEKYFDARDGFKSKYSPDESLFVIYVPLELSNASDAYKSYYKSDRRAIKVDQNNQLGSIEEYCKLVCQNLRYDRKISIKL